MDEGEETDDDEEAGADGAVDVIESGGCGEAGTVCITRMA